MSSSALLPLRTAAYAIAVALVVSPLIDYFPGVMPFRLGVPEWRFAALGLLAGFVLTPLLGALVAVAAAGVFEHRFAARVLGAACVLFGAVFLLSIGAFLLDAIQVRGGAPEEAKSSLLTTMIRSTAKLGVGGLGFLMLGLGAWRMAAGMRTDRRDSGTRDGVPLMATSKDR